jgi:hypothetical protein
MPPPKRSVAAKIASAARDWDTFPSPWVLIVSIYLSLKIVLPHMQQVEPPLRFEWLPFGGLMRRKRGSNSFCLSMKYLVTEYS